MNARASAGFTLIELLIILVITSIAIAVSLTGIRNYAAYQKYNQAVTDVRLGLLQARTEAQQTVDGAGRGVYITATALTFYTGTSYSAGNATNVTVSYPNITFSPSFSGGVIDLVFAPLTGYANAAGTLSVVGVGPHTDTAIITVTAGGVIE